jgi:hypothetical protein
VVNQVDTLPVDPDDDAESFHLLCQAKRDELLELLRRADPGTDWQIHFTSADPYGLVANTLPVTHETYDESYRAWDGVAELHDVLQSLPERREAVRTAASIRYWRLTAREALRVGETAQRKLRDELTSLRRAHAELRAWKVELDELDLRIRDDLRLRIKGALHSIAAAARLPENAESPESAVSRVDGEPGSPRWRAA